MNAQNLWRVIVVGGHTRNIGKTQLVCDIIAAFPRANWVAGKITQYGHGVCPRSGENCDCAPKEHTCAITWETHNDTGTDSARFLEAGAQRSFWLRTKQGFLADALPLLRNALRYTSQGESGNLSDENSLIRINNTDLREIDERPTALIVESNSLMQFVKPTLYFAVVNPAKEDFKTSAKTALDQADAIVLRGAMENFEDVPAWTNLPAHLLQEKPSVTQREGEPIPNPLRILIERALEALPQVAM
jgi:hypothetical protein